MVRPKTAADASRSERDFHNLRADSEQSPSERLSYAYHSMADVLQIPTSRLPASGGAVLEVGCYLGENSVRASAADQYVGVDMSDRAIEKAIENYGSAKARFLCLDANHLERLDGQFDFVFGNGVIHHLDLDRFSAGLLEKMKPDSTAVFVEPMIGPVWLRLFRKLTPRLRTEDEHPLDERQIEVLRRYFEVRIEYFGVARPLLPMLFFNAGPVVRFAAWLDRQIMRTEVGRRYAWLIAMTFTRRAGREQEKSNGDFPRNC